MPSREKLVLAYSGGLDTSVAIRWLRDQGYDVVALTIDLGEKKDLDAVQERALRVGAVAAYVVDGKVPFLRDFVWPSLLAGAVYEGEYPLATALGRPLIAAILVQIARREGATGVAHGCTGKGNDQVRFDVTTAALAPELRVVAPVRDWGMNREDEIEYAREHGIEVPASAESPYSVDENLWGRSVEAGILEDPWAEPPADVFEWTVAPERCPEQPTYLELGFREGLPVTLDGRPVTAVELVERGFSATQATVSRDIQELGFVAETQRHVTGQVRLKLYRGSSLVVGRKAPEQLYRMELATYGRDDRFDHTAAAGFIKLFGMGVRTAAEVQGTLTGLDLDRLLPAELKRLVP